MRQPKSAGPREITDPLALRALAHPLRLRMIAFLNSEGPATATRLASEFQTSTASTSYHLSQLAKHGLIEPALEERVGRERPWRSVGSFRFSSTGSPEFAAAARLLRDHSIDLWLQIVNDYLAREETEHTEWREAAFMMDEVGWITSTELNELANELMALLSRYKRTHRSQRPPDARRVAFLAYGLPMGRTVAWPDPSDLPARRRRSRPRRSGS